ncbi:MAG: hypothetical protein A3H97_01185 [Acidobacteria bacterium RIFCSPLOWO2_02_FULL_65_29]|nr:MAG: hypothetical protein A3H97_01185 [Acidobacteria bacterium RIFCSPLOWO2_02_FULL_65_29]
MQDIRTVENHDAAYDIWKAAGARNRVLVHVDGHVDFEWMNDHVADELLAARSSVEIQRLLAETSAWHFDERPLRERVTPANFIYPAIKEGLVREFIWIMPDAFWASPAARRVIRDGLEQTLRRGSPEAGPLRVSNGGIRFRLLGCPVTACTLATLPRITEPVLLDIDVDYLLTTNPAGPAPYFQREPAEPWLWPSAFFRRLRSTRLKTDLLTIAYSVDDGFTLLRYKYFGDLLRRALGEASERVSDAPVSGSAAEAFDHVSRSLSAHDMLSTGRWWREMVRRDPSYRSVYAIPGWREECAGRWDAALDIYQRMIEIDPEWHVPHLGRGRALWQFGRYAEAETAFEAAASRSSRATSATYWLGLCRFRRQDLEGASRAWTDAVRADPRDGSSLHGLACVEAQQGQARAGGARIARGERRQWNRRRKGLSHMTDLHDPLGTRYEHEPSIVTRRVAGEVILVPTRQMSGDAALFTLDEVAAFLWERLDGQRTGKDLVAALESSYAAEPEQAAADVRTFLEQLESIDAVRRVSESRRATNHGPASR